MASKQIEAIRQELRNLAEGREAILSQSTARKLERLDTEMTRLQAELGEVERVENSAKHAIQPSAEENELWTQIRRLSDEEASILRQRGVPERFVRADALEHFAEALKQRRTSLEASSGGLKSNQKHGPRTLAEFNALQAEEQTFLKTIAPVCRDGQRLAAIRQQKLKMSEQRDTLRLEREEKALAGVR